MIKAQDIIRVDDEIELRRFSHDVDEVKFRSIMNNRDRLLPWLPWAAEYHDISDMIKFTESQISEFDHGTIIGYDIFYHGQFAGAIDLHEVCEQHRYCYMGYWLDREFTNKGIMTRSAGALADYALSELGLHRVTIDAAPENEASLAVAKRLNFEYEATLREEQHLTDDKYHDTVMYTKFSTVQ